ncbi:TIR domain-containing protein [Erythrobacter sp. GH1-10]|uniref:TIR domain-containing protein n=1 Tax=Erythrobacter sp. GH1-10 TaxID=3349334 RepID=UPI00387818CF
MSGSERLADGVMQGSDVFLSYSRDDQAAAGKILELLEQSGISVWWDAMLEGGARFHEVTEFNLENAAAVVVLWSKVSTQSHWVHDEATRGRDRGCLIPVSIDGTLPPLGFRQFQWIDVSGSTWSLDDPQIAKLVHAVEAKRGELDGELPKSSPMPPLAQPVASASGLSRRTALIGGAGAAALAAGGLVAWSSGMFGGAGSSQRLAVLPFQLLGDASEQGYFVEGFATEIRSLLARNPLLHVAARASSNAFRESEATAGEICKKLGVDFLLAGDLRIEAGRIIGNAELAEGVAERVVRPFDIDAPLDSILALQQQIASEIVQELSGSDSSALSGRRVGGTDDVAAYDAFLRGREMYESAVDEATDRAALAQFDEAIRLDPEYAAALAMRGRALTLIGNLYTGPKEADAINRAAIEAAEKAIAIAPEFADGHIVLGGVRASRQLDMGAARSPYERSRELGAGDADILSRYALFRARMGDYASARNSIDAALSLDPLNSRVFRFAGSIEYSAGNFSRALESFERALELQNPLSSYHYNVGLIQMAMGDLAAAKTSFEADDLFVWTKTGLAIVEDKLGNRPAAEAHFAELQAQEGDKSNYQYMQIQAQWGDIDAALSAMDAAWEMRDPGLVQLYSDPLLEPLRGNARYANLAQRMGFV